MESWKIGEIQQVWKIKSWEIEIGKSENPEKTENQKIVIDAMNLIHIVYKQYLNYRYYLSSIEYVI